MLQERSTPPDVARREKRVVTEPLPPIKLANASMTVGSHRAVTPIQPSLPGGRCSIQAHGSPRGIGQLPKS